MRVHVEEDRRRGPTHYLSDDEPRGYGFTIVRERAPGRDDDTVTMDAQEAMTVGLAMVEWAKSQGVKVST